MTIYNTDPSTYTIGAAWASSPLGQPGETIDPTGAHNAGFVANEPRRGTRGAAFVAAMLGALAVAPIVGFAVYLYTDSDAAQPTAVIPGPGIAPAIPPAPAASIAPGTVAPAPPPADPNPVVRVPERTVVRAPDKVVLPPAGGGQASVGAPPAGPAGDTAVIVDVPVIIPPLAPIPELPPVADPPPAPEPDPDPDPEALSPIPDPGLESPLPPPVHELPDADEPPVPGAGPHIPTPDWTPDFSGIPGM